MITINKTHSETSEYPCQIAQDYRGPSIDEKPAETTTARLSWKSTRAMFSASTQKAKRGIRGKIGTL